MHSTSVVVPAEHRDRLATGYGRFLPGQEHEMAPFTDLQALAPAGNFSSTIEDLARFAALQFRDEAGPRQVLKTSTLREMHRVHWLSPDWQGGRGLGFVAYRHQHGTLVGHSGMVPGHHTQILISPAAKIAVVILSNASDTNPFMYADRALGWVSSAVHKAAIPASQPPSFDPAWHCYTGKYRSTLADIQVLVLHDQLALINPTEMNPEGALYELIPVDEHCVRIEGGDGSGPVGEKVVFELAPDGTVAHLKLGPNYAYPHAEY